MTDLPFSKPEDVHEKLIKEMNTRLYGFLIGTELKEMQLMTTGSDAVAYCRAKYPTGYAVVVISGDNEQKAPGIGLY